MEEEEENLIVKGMVVKLCCLFEIKCYKKKSYFFDIYVFDNLIVILCVYRVFSVGF